MNKSVSILVSVLFFAAVTSVAANLRYAKQIVELDFSNRADSAITHAATDNQTTQPLPGAHLTGYNLLYWNNVSSDTYRNYTSVDYVVYIYAANFSGAADNTSVNGTIYLTFDAFGNNSYTPPSNRSQIWEYRVGAMIEFANSCVSNITFDRQIAILESDVSNFLRAWVINAAYPYLLTQSNSSTNTTNTTQTFYLPNYYNETQLYIDCSTYGWDYCSGANPQSNLFFSNAQTHNLSITVNQSGYGSFNGSLVLSYVANFINFTNTDYGKESLIANLQGNATVYLDGVVSPYNGTFYVWVSNSSAYASASIDREYFVSNAAESVTNNQYSWMIQAFVNRYLSIRFRY